MHEVTEFLSPYDASVLSLVSDYIWPLIHHDWLFLNPYILEISLRDPGQSEPHHYIFIAIEAH